MGMRCDQFMGLNEWASNFVTGEPVFVCMEEVIRVYPDDRRETLNPRPVYESSVKKEESGDFYLGMFDQKHPLYKYTFLNGRVYYEGLQAATWSSGPVHFLALRDENQNWVPESLWLDEIIEAA